MDIQQILESHRKECGLEVIPEEWWMTQIRFQRDKLLAECDWTQTADAPVDKTAWAAYRQELRDLPANVTDPKNVIWPTPPA